MIRAVEEYIYERKGRRVQIVFNNLARFAVHFDMLLKAYHFVLEYKKTNK
jgi:hypothetical protein